MEDENISRWTRYGWEVSECLSTETCLSSVDCVFVYLLSIDFREHGRAYQQLQVVKRLSGLDINPVAAVFGWERD